MRYFKSKIGAAFVFALLAAATIAAQTQSSVRIRLEPYVSGLSAPLLLTNARDGTRRNFIVQQGGIIKVVQPGAAAATDFLNISSKIVAGGEQGLLGLAFHPQFAANGYFFVNYTRISDGATVIARYKTASSANVLGDPNSERIVLVIPQPFSNHNGGMIEFRTDNNAHNLYIGMGDGGSGNDPGNRAQNINDLLGKFLRITPDVSGNNANPAYTIPADNPFVGTNGADEIYAVGLRNPFRWSFDRQTRELWAGDVGQNVNEEVDIITRGGNYGWRVYEGDRCTNIDPALCVPANYTPPVVQYAHGATGRCSVTGGYVYRGARNSLPNGGYVYADYCTGEIFLWNNNQQTVLLDTTRNIASFGEDEDGELYVVGLGGTVERIARVGKAFADFDGDGRTDFSVFRPASGVWYILNSAGNSFRAQQFGQNEDIPTAADYDGDGRADIAVFRPSNGTWYYIRSSNNTFTGTQFGQTGDIPIVGDYDGDGRADLAVSRGGFDINAPRFYYILQSSNAAFRAQQWRTGGDRPVVGDFDGDGRDDIAAYRDAGGFWYVLQSSNGTQQLQQFGTGGDTLVPADYDGDGKTDKAVFRPSPGNPSTGIWYILRSSNNSVQSVPFGFSANSPAITDSPVRGDFDGDGRNDIAVFRPSNGVWYYIRSGNDSVGGVQFGQNGDLPIPRRAGN